MTRLQTLNVADQNGGGCCRARSAELMERVRSLTDENLRQQEMLNLGKRGKMRQTVPWN